MASGGAAVGVDAGLVAGADPGAAERATRSFLAGAGNLADQSVRVDTGAESITVRVHGRPPQLVPGFAWRVTAVAEAPLERFVPSGERS